MNFFSRFLGNFLYNRQTQKCMLVDFGLAQNIGNKEDSTNNTLGETSNEKKRKASEIEETENSNASNALKRVRTQYSQQEQQPEQPSRSEQLPSMPQQHQLQPSAVIANENASPRRLLSSSIPSQPFKSPLKEINELTRPKNTLKAAGLDAPLTRHIKSAVLGFSIKSKMESNQRSSTNPTAANNPTKYTTDNRRSSSNNNATCYCYGRSTVCNLCLVKKEIQASRAGTPGKNYHSIPFRCSSTHIEI